MELAPEHLPERGRVLVAVSGGPDSTALLLALQDLPLEVVAAHFDHALRPGSDRDAQQVAELCQKLGVQIVLGVRQEQLPPGSIQAAARELRLRFLEEARRRTGSEVVAVGHTADDVVEGMLLHLLRGSALAGLRGMPARRGVIVRPLLRTWRSQIVAFLAERGLDPLLDPSNEELRHARVRIRRQLLPSLERDLPGLSLRLFRVAGRAAAMQAELDVRAGALLHAGRVSILALAAESEAVRLETMRLLFVGAGGLEPGLDRRTLASMDRLARLGASGDGLDLPGGLRLRRLYGEVEVGPVVGPSPAGVTIVRWTCAGCDSASAVHLRPGARLTLGTRSVGLRMRPLPDRGSRKLQDILVDAKVRGTSGMSSASSLPTASWRGCPASRSMPAGRRQQAPTRITWRSGEARKAYVRIQPTSSRSLP